MNHSLKGLQRIAKIFSAGLQRGTIKQSTDINRKLCSPIIFLAILRAIAFLLLVSKVVPSASQKEHLFVKKCRL